MASDQEHGPPRDDGSEAAHAIAIHTSLKPLESFPDFPRLPRELRQKIWLRLLSRPRVLGIAPEGLRSGKKGNTLVAKTTSSPVLKFNSESRLEALKVQQPFYKEYIGAPMLMANLNVDVLYIQGYDRHAWFRAIHPLYKGRFREIKRLAVSSEYWYSYDVRDSIATLGPQEIFLIINPQRLCPEHDAVLIKPNGTPDDHLAGELLLHLKITLWTGDPWTGTWDSMAQYFQRSISGLKTFFKFRLASLQERMTQASPTENPFVEWHRQERREMERLSRYEPFYDVIPTVTFAEITTERELKKLGPEAESRRL